MFAVFAFLLSHPTALRGFNSTQLGNSNLGKADSLYPVTSSVSNDIQRLRGSLVDQNSRIYRRNQPAGGDHGKQCSVGGQGPFRLLG